jgi:hypothetical protein
MALRQKDFAHRPRFQLWTDALRFREMAKEAANNYLRSMCVRNAVLSAWTTLEMACCDALGIVKLGNDFRRSLDEEFDKKAIARLDFGSGLWSKINCKTKEDRKKYTHFGVTPSDRFPSIEVAEDAIKTIREAIHDIYARMGKPSPKWVNLDESDGWPQTRGVGISMAHLTVSRGADPNAPDTYSIVLVTKTGEEKPFLYLAGTTPEEDVSEEVEALLGRSNVPFSCVRVYRGQDLIHEEDV